MTYTQAISHLTSLEKFGSHPGLGNIRSLLKKLDNPQNNLKYIHVAGTNGKGSTCSFLAHLLAQHGFKVGLYTSPHIHSIHERIQIVEPSLRGTTSRGNPTVLPLDCHGSFISPRNDIYSNKKEFRQNEIPPHLLPITYYLLPENCFTKHAQTIIQTNSHVTHFEFLTCLSFLYFEEQKCDYVVLETGLGGRLDATNIIPPPELAILTPISYDHCDILGSTLLDIATEKCGIIKGSHPVLTASQPPEVLNTIRETCRHCEAKLIEPWQSKPDIDFTTSLTHTTLKYKNQTYKINLLGLNQIANATLAIEALNILSPRPKLKKKIFAKRKSTTPITYCLLPITLNPPLPCRFQVAHTPPTILLDVGHNPQGGEILAQNLRHYFPNQKITFIIGMLKDKDVAGYIEKISPLAEKIICTTPPSPRALPAQALYNIAKNFTPNAEINENILIPHSSFLTSNSITCICGSFTLFGGNQ